MDLEKLLKAGRLHKEKISSQEVQRALVRAKRDLKTARKIMADDWDWGFSITYNAVFQASRAFMFAQGYRPSHGEGHKNTFAPSYSIQTKNHRFLPGFMSPIDLKENQACYGLSPMPTLVSYPQNYTGDTGQHPRTTLVTRVTPIYYKYVTCHNMDYSST